MARKLPPLHLFYIFEASARHGSFKLASEELFLSPSAVSHQIKALEQYLGFDLFDRKSRKVELNSAGKMYLYYVQKSIETLEKGTAKVKNKFTSPALKISTFPTMAGNVIIPQLGNFQQAHPEIDIRIETALTVADLKHDDCDLAIRLGQGDWPDVEITKLMDIEVAALCTPKFAEEHQLNSLEKLLNVPLIDLSNMDNIWQTWSANLDLDLTHIDHKLTFSSYEAALQAAEQSLGVVLALLPVERGLLDRNILINPFKFTVPFYHSMYAVYRKEDNDRHDIQCFIDWLMKSPILSLSLIHI